MRRLVGFLLLVFHYPGGGMMWWWVRSWQKSFVLRDAKWRWEE